MSNGFVLHNAALPRSHKLFQLGAGTFCLGRSVTCDFVVADETVSRRHARITVADMCVEVRDLGSRNGTFLDGARIEECRVLPGHQLRFGDVIFELSNLESGERKQPLEDETASGQGPSARPERDSKFSPAEHRILSLLLKGLAEKEIGRRLHLSRHTVHNHVRAIYRILEVHSRAELLVRLARTAKHD